MKIAEKCLNKQQSDAVGNIYKIQRFCINDGPGIRTTVFLKGCQFSCKWCHNPETLSPGKDILVNSQLCVFCGKCSDVCPQRCHTVGKSTHTVNRDICQFCGRCRGACPNKAIEIAGSRMSIDDVMAVIRRDEIYYAESGGGVTISGGEPLLQAEFICRLTDACRQSGLTVYIDTNGSVPNNIFRTAAANADGLLFDLKMINPQKHRRYTGAGNDLVLQNFQYICGIEKDLIVRYVVVPGINDLLDDMSLLAELLHRSSFTGRIEFLAYHRLGVHKYSGLNIGYEMADIEPPSESDMKKIMVYFTDKGFNASFRN